MRETGQDGDGSGGKNVRCRVFAAILEAILMTAARRRVAKRRRTISSSNLARRSTVCDARI